MRFNHSFGPGPGIMMPWFGLVPAIIGALFMLALLTLTIIIIIKVLRHKHHGFSGRTNSNSHIDNALAILNERYAKSEISDEEYQKKKSEITKP
jgi:putative membrane protein